VARNDTKKTRHLVSLLSETKGGAISAYRAAIRDMTSEGPAVEFLELCRKQSITGEVAAQLFLDCDKDGAKFRQAVRGEEDIEAGEEE